MKSAAIDSALQFPAEMRYNRAMKKGFSLIELSIVLVILGLLVGGILAGRSLIHASELRAVMNESTRYKTALYAFRDKYFALPGDITNATAIWGKDTTSSGACASQAGNAATPGTCNGDGDGYIGTGSTSGAEGTRAWQQLALAGLIEGNYTGYYDTGPKLTRGVNVPISKQGAGGWALLYRSLAGGPVWGNIGNYLQYGAESAGELWLGAVSAEDAWNIDTKLDDGQPDYGRLFEGRGSPGVCLNPDSGYWSTAAGGHTYNFTGSTPSGCVMFFRL